MDGQTPDEMIRDALSWVGAEKGTEDIFEARGIRIPNQICMMSDNDMSEANLSPPQAETLRQISLDLLKERIRMTTAHTDNFFNHLNTDNHQNNQLPNLNTRANVEVHNLPLNIETSWETPKANSDRSWEKVNPTPAPQQRRVLTADVMKKQISSCTADT